MFEFNIEDKQFENIFFIGIGGISMSAIAELLLSKDYNVFGSDAKKSHNTEKLEKNGATIYYSHSKEHIKDIDLVIYTDAISLDNVELKEAINEKIDIIDRATFLGALMKNFKKSIAVSGTHGKTTTTSMIAEIIKSLDNNPTIMLGGELDNIDGNIKIGENNLFLTEACEYKANILKYYPSTAIILNIDEDHLDYFDNIEHIIKTFKGYVDNLGELDNVILNIDDENVNKLFPIENTNVTTTSMTKDADFSARDISFSHDGYPSYNLYHKGEFISEVKLQVLGKHNVSNSLCAIAACFVNGVDISYIVENIFNYRGVHRRLEFKGMYNESFIMDDYAHHPTEIKSSIHALKKSCKGKLYTIFQPHTFTRTKILLDGFSKSFAESDIIIITDIYAAREKDYGDIHSKTLVNAIKENHKNAIYIENFDDIISYLKKNLKKNDMAVTMGAGNVYEIGEKLLKI